MSIEMLYLSEYVSISLKSVIKARNKTIFNGKYHL